ncbi:hypothetical protein N2152v2_009947 [Parachlorella kessleri]
MIVVLSAMELSPAGRSRKKKSLLSRYALSKPGTFLAAALQHSKQSHSAHDGSSNSPAQPCPLHACLLRYGIPDLAAFSAPRHMALSQEAVSSNAELKLAALAAEGLSPKQMAQLMGHKKYSLLTCSFNGAFLPNLQLLRQIGEYINYKPHPKAPHLTVAGKLLANKPGTAALYLSRDPSKVQQLLQWLEGSLGVGLEQLAASNSVCNALIVSASAASAVCSILQEQQVASEQVAQMLIRHPTIFNHRPEVLSARLVSLQQHLGLDTAAALQVVIAHPRLLTNNLDSTLPPLLLFLDGYMGEEGAGRRLVRAQPSLGSVTAASVERSVGKLAARGYSQQRIQGVISKRPDILSLDLDSQLQQQKLDWIEQVSPWTLDDFLATPAYFTATTRRLAARLALLRECRLLLPPTPRQLAIPSSATFMAVLRKRLEKQGQELPWASWAEWEEAWLGSEEGRKWGFLPLKD